MEKESAQSLGSESSSLTSALCPVGCSIGARTVKLGLFFLIRSRIN